MTALSILAFVVGATVNYIGWVKDSPLCIVLGGLTVGYVIGDWIA